MITIIICIIVVFIMILLVDSDELEIAILGGLVIGGIIGFVISYSLPSKREIVKTTYILESFEDNHSTDGNFFIGSGIIEEKTKYVFYYKKDDFYKLEMIDNENSYIKYIKDSSKPRVEEFKTTDTKCFRNYFAFDSDEYKYIIYVPKGTIKQNYSLDTK